MKSDRRTRLDATSEGAVLGRPAVLLLCMGGPESLDDVAPYLKRFFSDPDMIDLPLGRLYLWALARIIAKKRAPTSIERYTLIGGRSPLNEITRRQADKLQAALAEADDETKVYVAMRYNAPFAAEVLGRMRADGIGRALALPLNPQFCKATNGSAFRDLERAVKRVNPGFPIGRVESWHDNGPFLDALAGKVQEAIDRLPATLREKAPLLFCAHAVPKAYVDQGDPYLDQVRATAEGLGERIDRPWSLAFQSRLGPVEWVGPSVEEAVDEIAGKGAKAMVAAPVSFVADNLETLYDMDIALKDRAKERGIDHFIRAEALNDHPHFIAALREITTDHMK